MEWPEEETKEQETEQTAEPTEKTEQEVVSEDVLLARNQCRRCKEYGHWEKDCKMKNNTT